MSPAAFVTSLTVLPYELSYYLNDLLQRCEEQGETDMNRFQIISLGYLTKQILMVMYRKLQINHCIIGKNFTVVNIVA